MKDWPLRRRIAHELHVLVNRLAVAFHGKSQWQRKSHTGPFLWRLNDWLADQWVPWWIRHG